VIGLPRCAMQRGSPQLLMNARMFALIVSACAVGTPPSRLDLIP
jgi:hypothetical protein